MLQPKPLYLMTLEEIRAEHKFFTNNIKSTQGQIEQLEAQLENLRSNELVLRGALEYAEGIEKLKKIAPVPPITPPPVNPEIPVEQPTEKEGE